MDKTSAQKLIKETFNYPFKEENFSKFSINLLNNIKIGKSGVWEKNTILPNNIKENVLKYKIFGQMDYDNGDKIIVIIVKLNSKETVEKTRHVQRNLSKWFIDKYEVDSCLISFFAENYEDWRFSFVKIDYKREITKDGKINVKEDITPVKRFSYLVGKNEPSHTAQSQLVPLLEKENVQINDLTNAFSVENVTKEFFNNYKKLCFEIVDNIKDLRLKDKKIDKEFKINQVDNFYFAKKIMSQVIFLYFLQKRGLLGVKKNNKKEFNNWGSGSKKFIRELFNQKLKKYKNFYNDILEPLFFEGLAKERDDDYFSFLDCKIPFLNGGLFERYYNWSESYIIIDNIIIKNILDTFDRFNFTVVEEDPLDKEVAIDPEVLGKVFESLIDIKDRKKQGIFYTPREIVFYMCNVTLKNFIIDRLNDENFKYNLEEIDLMFNPSDRKWSIKEKINLDNKTLNFIYENLKNIKICDPAIGSGAFQLGMLNILVFVIKKVRQQINKNQISDYRLKKNIIQNNLYGVDIKYSSVEIARFRLWLSLIIEDESVKKIEPLPNLDYKIIHGNSLSYVIENLFNNTFLDELIKLKESYFQEANFSTKEKLKKKIDQLENNIGLKSKFDFKLNFADIFQKSRKKKGFDIIIGNPPYVGVQGNKEKFREINQDKNNPLKIFHTGKMDYFYFFFHQGINITKEGGQIALITTNYYLTATAGDKLRSDIKNRCKISTFVNFNELKIFDSAKGIHNIITILKKDSAEKNHKLNVIQTNRRGFVDSKTLYNILNYKDSSHTNYYEISSKDIYKTENNYIFINQEQDKSENLLKENILEKMLKNSLPLIKLFNVNQGTQSGCDSLTKSHINNFELNKNCKLNDGIFVFDLENKRDQEVIKTFNNSEKKYLKDFYKNSDINQFVCSSKPKKKLMYILWNDEINKLPNIKIHLAKFKKILEQRLVTYNEDYPWYALHRPRNINIFLGPKIVVPYRSKLNIFAYNEVEWFCRSDCYIITSKSNQISLKALLGILNSKLYYMWLFSRGKRKGNTLELFSKPLSEIPLRIFDNNINNNLEKLINKIINNKNLNNNITIKKQIDDIIYKTYQLSEKEINFVENFFSQKLF